METSASSFPLADLSQTSASYQSQSTGYGPSRPPIRHNTIIMCLQCEMYVGDPPISSHRNYQNVFARACRSQMSQAGSSSDQFVITSCKRGGLSRDFFKPLRKSLQGRSVITSPMFREDMEAWPSPIAPEPPGIRCAFSCTNMTSDNGNIHISG